MRSSADVVVLRDRGAGAGRRLRTRMGNRQVEGAQLRASHAGRAHGGEVAVAVDGSRAEQASARPRTPRIPARCRPSAPRQGCCQTAALRRLRRPSRQAVMAGLTAVARPSSAASLASRSRITRPPAVTSDPLGSSGPAAARQSLPRARPTRLHPDHLARSQRPTPVASGGGCRCEIGWIPISSDLTDHLTPAQIAAVKRATGSKRVLLGRLTHR